MRSCNTSSIVFWVKKEVSEVRNQVVSVPANGPSYWELEDKVIWLQGKLAEARRSRHNAETLAWMCLLLFAVTATLLALIWSGVIVI